MVGGREWGCTRPAQLEETRRRSIVRVPLSDKSSLFLNHFLIIISRAACWLFLEIY